MKKHSILGLALLVLFSFGTLQASVACAEEEDTLLAEWLVNGGAIATLTSTEAEVALILRDNKVPIAGAAAVKCEAILDGSVGPDGEDEVTEVLNLSLVAVSLGGTELSCPLVEGCEENGKVAMINLPWLTLLQGYSELFVDSVEENAAKTLPGYEVTCKVFEITQADTCTAANHSGSMVSNGASDVLLTSETLSPNGNCSIGGAGSGVISVAGGLVLTLTGTLQVSLPGEESTLLAEWLVNGGATLTLTSTEIVEDLILKDNKVPIAGTVAVLCEGILVGSVGPNGEDEVTEVLNLSLAVVSLGGTELSCPLVEGCEEAGTVAPINLPWHTSLELVVASPELFTDLAVEGATGLTGYEVTCKVFGVTQTDTCTAINHSGVMVENGASEVMLAKETITPNGNCSIGGAGTSVTMVGEGLFVTLSGTLQVSSE